MPMVQVHNDDHEDYVETYRNEKIVVPSRSFLDMERSKAIGFLGSFSGVDSQRGTMKVKRLRIIEDEHQRSLRMKQPQDESFKCQACGHDFLSDEELDVHISVHHKAEQIKDKPNAKGRKR